MRILTYEEFLLSDPISNPVDHRPLLSKSFEQPRDTFASLSILAKIASANLRLIDVLSQLGRMSSSLASYEKTCARRQRSQHFKALAESSAYHAATASRSSDSLSQLC